MSPPSSAASISVIIPVWRDLERVAPLLELLHSVPVVGQVIVALAGAPSGGRTQLEQLGAEVVEASAPGRGGQLDLGAQHASCPWLLFQHADTAITAAHLQALSALNPTGQVVGGAFYRRFDERHPHLRWLEKVERWHNRTFGALYGDQSIFVRRDVFQRLGGFGDLPLMEDVNFSLRLRRHGPLALLDPPLASSPRKHLQQGPWRTTLQNASLILLYRLGLAPAFLHRIYYRNDI